MNDDDIPEIFHEIINRDEFHEKINEIEKRCKNANIKLDKILISEDLNLYLEVYMPCGRDARVVYIQDYNDLIDFLNIDFEDLIFIGNYSAIYDRKKGIIEAVVSSPEALKLSGFFRYRFIKELGIKDDSNGELLISPPSNIEDGVQLKLQKISKSLKLLNQEFDHFMISLEIKCPKILNHDECVKILNRMANALFFEIDLLKGLHLSLLRKTEQKYNEFIKNNQPITYPKNSYDEAPMALYWYARSAINMPLLQFLAYYQTIEFYYPVFYNVELSKKVKAIIKNPMFRVDQESDISKIVSAIRGKGIGVASEKDQLRATIRECIDNEDIENFLSKNDDRKKFFFSKAKGITSFALNSDNKNHDLCSQVTDRIYDIRCKIVHIKGDEGDGDFELLLPYSKEAEKLEHDIELVRLIAQKVLVYTSKTMV